MITIQLQVAQLNAHLLVMLKTKLMIPRRGFYALKAANSFCEIVIGCMNFPGYNFGYIYLTQTKRNALHGPKNLHSVTHHI